MMTVTRCPRRVSAAGNASTTSDKPPLVANGRISEAIITIRRLSLPDSASVSFRGAGFALRRRGGIGAGAGSSAGVASGAAVEGFEVLDFDAGRAFAADACRARAAFAAGAAPVVSAAFLFEAGATVS